MKLTEEQGQQLKQNLLVVARNLRALVDCQRALNYLLEHGNHEDAIVAGLDRTSYILEESIAVMSLVNSSVFEDFPKLKLIISHGGGAIPYQIGRFRANLYRQKGFVGAALRVIPSVIPSLEELGLPKTVAGLAMLSSGLLWLSTS